MTILRWVAVSVVAALLVVPVVLAPLTGHRLLVVDGGSMAPTYEVGDVLITDAPTGDDLHPGRIVVVDASPSRYTHRVARLDSAGTRARLQGDANPTPDPSWVSQADVEAVPVAHLGGAPALLVRTVTAMPGRIALLVVLVTLLFLPRRRVTRTSSPRTALILR